MKRERLIIFVLATLLIATIAFYNSSRNNTNITKPPAENVEGNPTLNTIFSRKSVRKYTDQKIDRSALTMLAKAAMAAPSAMNKQPWHLIAIDSRSELDRLAAVMPYGKMLAQASAAMVVCGDRSRFIDGAAELFWTLDCAAATENLLLAAESMSIGGVWLGVYPDETRMNNLKKLLNLADNLEVFAVVSLGYGTGAEQPKNKWQPDRFEFLLPQTP